MFHVKREKKKNGEIFGLNIPSVLLVRVTGKN